VGAPVAPDVVTMNNAHDTHFTDNVPTGIRHVLRGWGDADGPARHAVRERDLFVRNVPTNVRDLGGTRHAGNSIFVFEAADLCIAHLGHLHHTLTPEHLAALGSIDVLLTPVDGAYTMAQSLMREVVEAIRPSLIVPMHYFGSSTLARFLDGLRDGYEVRTSDTPTVALSRATLPRKQVLVLPGF
jgi:L-ascorbate metabolism protein UlaG (beta-lactamase superfamily)